MSAESNIAKIKAKIAEAQAYAKFVAACVGGALTVGSSLIPTEWAIYATVGLAVLTAFSVWRFPNTPTPTGDHSA
ncbi:hypothetical protein [Cryobacterium arcticum]|uniref:Uncharacterized protein n=1 Tax=Cryobacterium arcticum TaxID=670052 RepID=A0A1B1BPH7_9MICO|nr:hypothetical protein [Cryobacterium arcticum]ANP74552.1 hypothetical protein PA27867_3634 [Cryobacterium arcticum]